MTDIVIRELASGPDGVIEARVHFGADGSIDIRVADPADREREELLAWYFEKHLEYPFLDRDLEAKAAEEALRDPDNNAPLALRLPIVRRVDRTPLPFEVPTGQTVVRILVVTARPYGPRDVGYRTISRPCSTPSAKPISRVCIANGVSGRR